MVLKQCGERAEAVAEALTRWEARGAPRLLARSGTLLLMEYVQAPTGANDSSPSSAALSRLCLQLWRAPLPPPGDAIPCLSRVCEEWNSRPLASEWEREIREARARSQRLLGEGAPVRLLHGDLHPGNILPSRRGWLAIDPHPLWGEPAYELEPLLRGALQARSPLPTWEERLQQLAPAERVLSWALVRAAWYGSACQLDGQLRQAAVWKQRYAGLKAWLAALPT